MWIVKVAVASANLFFSHLHFPISHMTWQELEINERFDLLQTVDLPYPYLQ